MCDNFVMAVGSEETVTANARTYKVKAYGAKQVEDFGKLL